MGGVISTGLHKPRKVGTKKSSQPAPHHVVDLSHDDHMTLHHPLSSDDQTRPDETPCDGPMVSDIASSLHHGSSNEVCYAHVKRKGHIFLCRLCVKT